MGLVALLVLPLAWLGRLEKLLELPLVLSQELLEMLALSGLVQLAWRLVSLVRLARRVVWALQGLSEWRLVLPGRLVLLGRLARCLEWQWLERLRCLEW